MSKVQVEVDDEVWIYYTGLRHMHGYFIDPVAWGIRRDLNYPADALGEMAIGLAKIKRDRFASLSCDGVGTVAVQHGTPGGVRLQVNARTFQGRLAVQVEQPDGTPLPGLTFAECQPFTGDSTAAEVTWSESSLAELAPDKEIALRFELKDADLFAYRMET